MYKNKFRIILFAICYLLLAHKASAAILYTQSANQDVYEGQTFVVDWFVDTERSVINTFDLKINFSKDILEVAEANPGSSLINLWIKPPTFDNQNGSIELTGGIANGLRNSGIPVFRTVFKAIKPGTASITFNPESQVLLNDGLGTSEPLKFKEILFNVYPQSFVPIQISSPTHPDSNTWYQNNNVDIKFSAKPDTDYSYSFSSNTELIPDEQKDTTPEIISYKNLPDGVYYFKLNSKVGPSTWQEAGIYRVQIDKTAPEEFVPIIGSDPSVFDGKSFVSFNTVDKTSGISHYKVKVGLFGTEEDTQSPYKLHKPIVGDNAAITAFDKAGNARTETIAWKGYISERVFKLILIVVLLILLFIFYKQKKQKTKHSHAHLGQ